MCLMMIRMAMMMFFGSFDGDDDADGDDDVPGDEELPHLAGAGLPVDIVAALHKRER